MELDSPSANKSTSSNAYFPHRSLRCAVQDWIPEFYRPQLCGSDFSMEDFKGKDREEEDGDKLVRGREEGR